VQVKLDIWRERRRLSQAKIVEHYANKGKEEKDPKAKNLDELGDLGRFSFRSTQYGSEKVLTDSLLASETASLSSILSEGEEANESFEL